MAFSPNSPQSREMTELRNHLKWLDEERRKTARKIGEMEQRIAQQGRDITEREKRIHELEWQLGQVSERIEQMPEMGTGSSGQEQRLQDLEWHMSNINAQLVRLPKLDDELARFREDLSQYTVDIENRLVAQQSDTSQRLENDVYSRLQQDISQSVSGYDARLASMQSELLDRISITETGLGERLDRQIATTEAELNNRLEQQLTATTAELNNRLEQQLTATTAGLNERLEQQVTTTVAGLNDHLEQQLVTTVAGLNDHLEQQLTTTAAGLNNRLDQQLASAQAAMNDNLNQQVTTALQSVQDDVLVRLSALEAESHTDPEIVERLRAVAGTNEQRLGELAALLAATQVRQDQFEVTLGDLKMDDGSLAAIARIEQELELRQAEELRLANLNEVHDNKLERANALIEEMNRVVAQMQSQAAETNTGLVELRGWYQELDDNWKPALMEVSGKIAPLNERLNVLSNTVTKADANIQTLAADQTEMRDGLTGIADEVRQARTDLASQVDNWQATIDEHKETIERFTQQWLTLSNQYKEARMAVQNFAHWQKQLEQQKREASEMLRVESNRMQSRWEGFLLEIQEQLKNVDLDLAQKWQTFELENEQRWVGARRNEQLWREELANVDDLIVKLQQDSRNLIWRVQAAQADAIKKWPRLLLEEVEKAVELNPNRRLQPTPGSARTDMSVVDAIEQGLIKVDYDDEASATNL